MKTTITKTTVPNINTTTNVAESQTQRPPVYVVNLGGGINSQSLSPDGQFAVLAGREVLKIVQIDQKHGIRESQNLRVGRSNLNQSSVDVKWHPLEQNKNVIATAATNGSVVIWNISRPVAQKQEKVIADHARTVNRLAWHTDHAFTLLSGSQDGTMKLWDIRDHVNCKVTFEGKSEAVRDVQFSPHFANYFAAAFDNGTVQIWDIRKHSSYERKIQCHQGPVFCVDWHPDDQSLIATGGRDRLINIWDLNGNCTRPSNSIQTVSSVSRINWRPNFKFHIASIGLVDSKIHVWDIKKPYIPLYSFVSHQDVVTDFAWHKPSHGRILSCSKDGYAMVQTLKDSYRPYENIRTVGLTWNPRGELAVISEKINRVIQDNPPEQQKEAPKSGGILQALGFGTKSVEPQQQTQEKPPPVFFQKNTMYLYTPYSTKFTAEVGENNSFVIIFLAQNYKFTEDEASPTFQDICEHNAIQASFVKLHHVSATWRMLKLFFKDGPVQLKEKKENPITETKKEIKSETSSSISFLEKMLDSSLLMDEYETNLSSSPNIGGFADLIEETSYGNETIDDLLSNDVTPLSPIPIGSLEVGLPPRPKQADVFEDSVLQVREEEEEEVKTFPQMFADELFWNPTPMVEESLRFYAEHGDVQSSVLMALVLGDRVTIDEKLFRHWCVSYIEILQRLQLWSYANEIIRKTQDQSIRSANQKSTTVHTSCSQCGKPLTHMGWVCETCKQRTNPCSLCHQLVKGLYVWCQGCGHGGHMKHISDWFTTEKYCPTGCGHPCNYRFAVSRAGKALTPSGSSGQLV